MNLVQDPWLFFQLHDGTEQCLPLAAALTNPEVSDFAVPRADFQGAAWQFAIGLLQSVYAPEDKYQWHERYQQPPDKNTLQAAFNRAAHAFHCSGDSALFMQDFDPLINVKPSTVAALLIEAPGEQGVKQNTDHFIKRGMGEVMSLEMACLALFTLQINAPSGGQGHRTGLRGGGPLTTVILPQQRKASLWQKLWLNVINREFWRYDEPNLHSDAIFPWLSESKTSEKKGDEVYPEDVHPLLMYWAMPRRIRLAVDEPEKEHAVCALTGQPAPVSVSYVRAKNYGANYEGAWDHPLTPYKWNPKKPEEAPLSVKGKPGGITYKLWDALTLTSDEQGQQCAKVVSHFYEVCQDFAEGEAEIPRLWALGMSCIT